MIVRLTDASELRVALSNASHIEERNKGLVAQRQVGKPQRL